MPNQPDTIKNPEKKYKKGINRRTFLKLAASVGVTAALARLGIKGADWANQNPLEVVKFLADKEVIIDGLLRQVRTDQSKKGMHELMALGVKEEDIVNAEKRDISDIVLKGIDDYLEKNPGKSVHYQFSKDRQPFDYYLDQLDNATLKKRPTPYGQEQNEEIENLTMVDFMEFFLNRAANITTLDFEKEMAILAQEQIYRKRLEYLFTVDQHYVLLNSEWNIVMIGYFIIPGSGLAKKLELANLYSPEEGKDNYLNPNDDHKTELFVMKYMQDALDFIITEYSKTNEPVSSSLIFSYFLDKNDGNIGESCLDMGIFLKYLARNDENGYFSPRIMNGNPDQNEAAKEFYSKRFSMIEDESSLLASYHTLAQYSEEETKGIGWFSESGSASVLNIMGLGYHTWFMAGLLHHFPTLLIKYMTLSEFNNYTNHGYNKIASDLQTLLELKNLEKLFAKVSKKNN